MQIDGAVMELLRAYAPTLQLQEETEARAQQVVEVVDGECRERVRVEGRGRAAAQTGDELLLEETLPDLVQHSHLTRRANQVGELVEQPRAHGMESPDP